MDTPAGTGRPDAAPLLELEDLQKRFVARRPWLGPRPVPVHAVDGVSLAIGPGESYALVGESGCGKTTTARMALRLLEPTAGRLRFGGRDIWWDGLERGGAGGSRRRKPVRLRGRALKPLRRAMQAVFQDPVSSLNPRMRVGAAVAEGLAIHRPDLSVALRAERVAELLALVGLPPDAAGRFPHEFSGGQRQRVGIARALAVEPRLLVADEAVSALDISVQAQIINLFSDLRDRLGLAYLFIAHDLAVVGRLARRVGVMYAGQLVEEGPVRDVLTRPLHPYTRELVAAAPSLARVGRREAPAENEAVAAAGTVTAGCRYAVRCPRADAGCRGGRVAMATVDGRKVRCVHAA